MQKTFLMFDDPSDREGRTTSRCKVKGLTDLLFVGIILACILAVFAPVLLSGHMLFGSDTEYFYSNYAFIRQSLQDGTFPPLRNPYLFSGTPFIANPQSAIFYPPSLLFYLLPLAVAFNASYVLHTFLAGISMFALARNLNLKGMSAFVAAMIYMLGGFMITRVYAGHLGLFNAAAWAPLVLLFFRQALEHGSFAYALLAGIGLALQVLAGHVAIPLYIGLVLGAYLPFHCHELIRQESTRSSAGRSVALAFVAIGVGVILPAIQILPFLEVSQLSTRQRASYEFAVSGALPIYGLILFLIPDFFGRPTDASFWGVTFVYHESVAYVGVLGLVLILSALIFVRNRLSVFFGLLMILSLTLALGDATPLYRLFYSVPGLSFLRGPSRFLFPFSIGASILAAQGYEYYLTDFPSMHRHHRTITILRLLVGAGLLGIVILLAGYLARAPLTDLIQQTARGFMHHPADPRGYLARIPMTMGSNFLLPAMQIALAIVPLGLFIKQRYHVAQVALVILLFFDLWSFDSEFIRSVPDLQPWWPDDQVTSFLAQDPGPYRVFPASKDGQGRNPLGTDNSGLRTGIASVMGFDPIVLKRYEEYSNAVAGRPLSTPHTTTVIADFGGKYGPSRLLDLLNVKYVIATEQLQEGRLEEALATSDIHVYRNRAVLPPAFIVPQARIVTQRGEIFATLQDTLFDPRRWVVLEETPQAWTPPVDADSVVTDSRVNIKNYEREYLRLEVSLPDNGLLFLSELAYPGWEVIVDGHLKQIYPANYLFMAVTLDQGVHVVEFRYRPQSVMLGLVVSVISVALVVVALGTHFVRNRGVVCAA